MLRGGSAEIASHYYQVRLGGDMAAVRGMSKAVLAADDAALAAGRPSVLDLEFLAQHTQEFAQYRASVAATSWEQIEDQSGLTREQIEEAARVYLEAGKVMCTWAMGITQHRHSVPTIREITNFLLLRGNLGRPGAGVCPVRGHSNVQGDRTVGINENPPKAFLDALEREFGFTVPREPGHNVLAAIGAMLDGSAHAFIGLGGNFARATPDSALVVKAMASLRMTVHIATKLNHSHLVPGKISFILPCLGRTEIDRNSRGVAQIVSVEDSMSMVHGSGGINLPAAKLLRSEVGIVAGIAAATVGSDKVDWLRLADDYDLIRNHIAAVIPGFEDYNERLRKPRGFYLRNTAREREWSTPSGKAEFFTGDLPEQTEFQRARDGRGLFVLQTFRSHDQYNTTVYGMDDRYRGVYGERRVVFINPKDLADLGCEAGDTVDIVGEHGDGMRRVAEAFRFVPYDIPCGCIAGYYPELNVLVPLTSAGDMSDTPTSKSVVVSLLPTQRTVETAAAAERTLETVE
jgi:formate dehydrogenase major subunit